MLLNRKVDDHRVGYAIDMTVMCQEFHVLPRAGGLLDQDAYDVWLMQLVVSAQHKRAELERNRQK